MSKKLKHAYVTLIDLPEALPFGVQPAKDALDIKQMEADQKKQQESDALLFTFIKQIRRNFKEELIYIGEDMIGEKFYKRFLFEKGGFVEIMTGVPIAISAHFTTLFRAKKFSAALVKALKVGVKEKKLVEILANTMIVNEEESSKLTYETWDKLRQIREGG